MNRGDLVQLADLLAERLAEREASPALVDARAAAAQLGVPPTWLLAEARANRVPHVRLGKYVRFSPDELSAWAGARVRGPRVAKGFA